MAILIEDNGNLLDITVSGEKHSLPKSSIELNVWDGHLIIWSFMRERYKFAYADVTTPSCASAELLRDAVADIINATEIDTSVNSINNLDLKTYYQLDYFELILNELQQMNKILKKIYQ